MQKIDTRMEARERYTQRLHAPGLASWVYSSTTARSVEKRWISGGLELAVVLDGVWQQESRFSTAATSCSGDVVRLSPGESYRHQHAANGGRLRQVGFVVHDAELAQLTGDGGELRFEGGAGTRDAALESFARWFEHHQSAVTTDQVRGAVLAYVRRHATSTSGPLVRAKQALERDFAFDVPLESVAREHGLNHLALTRGFKKQYGMTPASYRVRLRLNWASRLLWQQPGWSVERIGEEVGFRQKGYFHHAFRQAFGRTPGDARQRFG